MRTISVISITTVNVSKMSSLQCWQVLSPCFLITFFLWRVAFNLGTWQTSEPLQVERGICPRALSKSMGGVNTKTMFSDKQ